jgi:hypothetical protein
VGTGKDICAGSRTLSAGAGFMLDAPTLRPGHQANALGLGHPCRGLAQSADQQLARAGGGQGGEAGGAGVLRHQPHCRLGPKSSCHCWALSRVGGVHHPCEGKVSNCWAQARGLWLAGRPQLPPHEQAQSQLPLAPAAVRPQGLG